jgi:predicted oxidoreductase
MRLHSIRSGTIRMAALRINGRAQVIDMQGQPIPGLYAGGESSGGGNQHGLGRALVHGYIAGTNAVKESS